ncbi:hypothetical protein Pelo_19316 [Pelomyxa schiedti]|nr:hypothetical protein Pelo_19316 [Pelomyxa schiedti]
MEVSLYQLQYEEWSVVLHVPHVDVLDGVRVVVAVHEPGVCLPLHRNEPPGVDGHQHVLWHVHVTYFISPIVCDAELGSVPNWEQVPDFRPGTLDEVRC